MVPSFSRYDMIEMVESRLSITMIIIIIITIIIIIIIIYHHYYLRGRVDDLSFFEYLSPFCFLSIEFHCIFSIMKFYHILFIIIVFRLGSDKLSPVSSFPRDQSRDVTPRLGEGG